MGEVVDAALAVEVKSHRQLRRPMWMNDECMKQSRWDRPGSDGGITVFSCRQFTRTTVHGTKAERIVLSIV
jgi:hypothetical protein